MYFLFFLILSDFLKQLNQAMPFIILMFLHLFVLEITSLDIEEIKPLPEIYLSFNESKMLNLNDYFRGQNVTYLFNHFDDDTINFERNGTEFFDLKTITKAPFYEIIYLSGQSEREAAIKCAILNGNFQVGIFDIDLTPYSFHFQQAYMIQSDLICSDLERINDTLLIVECRSKTEKIGKFCLIQLNADDSNNPIYINNQFIEDADPNLVSNFRNCNKTIEIKNNFIFRYCKNSRDPSVSNVLQIFLFDAKNLNISFFGEIKLYENTIEDIDFYDETHIYLLDPNSGIVFVVLEENAARIIKPKFPTINDHSFYHLSFDCLDKDRLFFDEFSNCTLLLSSSHYISEIVVGKSFESNYYLRNHKNLGNNNNTVKEMLYSSFYFYIFLKDNDLQKTFLNVYERNDIYTNLYYQKEIDDAIGVSVRLIGLKNSYMFDHNLNNLIFFQSTDAIISSSTQIQYMMLDIKPNRIYFETSKTKNVSTHSTELHFEVSNDKKTSILKRKFNIHVINTSKKELSLSSNNFTTINISSLTFQLPLESLTRGPDKRYSILEEESNIKLNIDDYENFEMLFPYESDYIYLKSIEINLIPFIFIQNVNLNVTVYSYYIKEERYFFNVESNITLDSKIESIFCKGERIVIKTTKTPSKIYFYNLHADELTQSRISFIGILKVKNSEFECQKLVFNLYSTNAVCVNYDQRSKNEINFYFFNPSNYDPNIIYLQNTSYTSIDIDENFVHYDHPLLHKNIILAKGAQSISVFKFEFTHSNNVILKRLTVIRNEHTIVNNSYTGFHFLICGSDYFRKGDDLHTMKLLIINFETNVIAEYLYDNLITPEFSRFYPLFGEYTVNNNSLPKTEGSHLIVQVTHNLKNKDFFIIYNIQKDSGDNLIRIGDFEIKKFYISNEFNSPRKDDSNTIFITRNKDQDKLFMNIMNPVKLSCDFNLSFMQNNVNDSKETYISNNYSHNSSFTLRISNINNYIDLKFFLNYNYDKTLIKYSDSYIENVEAALTEIDLSENELAILTQFFDGAIFGYRFENNNTGVHYNLSTFIEADEQLDFLSLVQRYFQNSTYTMNLSSFQLTNIISEIQSMEFTFLLFSNKNLVMFDLMKLTIIDIFDLRENNLTKDCQKISYSDQNRFAIKCLNEEKKEKNYLVGYSAQGIRRTIQELNLTCNSDMKTNFLRIVENAAFIVETDPYHLSGGSILKVFIFNDSENSSTLTIIREYTIDYETLNIDYFKISRLTIISLLNNFFGILYDDGLNLFYVEVNLSQESKDIISQKIATIFVKDIIKDDYLKKGKPNNFISHTLVNNNGSNSINIIITTIYKSYEIFTKRSDFTNYKLIRKYEQYGDCEIQLQNTKIIVKPDFFINDCKPSDIEEKNPYIKFINLYNRSLTDGECIKGCNNTITKKISQILKYDIRYADYFVIQINNETRLLIFDDMNQIKTFCLNRMLKIRRTFYNRTHQRNIENPETRIKLHAFNHYSDTAVNLYIFNGIIYDEDLTYFYFLIVLPIVFCVIGMITLCIIIKIHRSKRIQSLKIPMIISQQQSGNINLIN